MTNYFNGINPSVKSGIEDYEDGYRDALPTRRGIREDDRDVDDAMVCGRAADGGGADGLPRRRGPAGADIRELAGKLDDFRFRWAAEPGVDLVSGPAVPLRAYLESYRIGQFTGDIGTAYPGFDRAVPALPPHSKASTKNELVDIRPRSDAEVFGPPGPFYGNEFFHILEITPIESGYRAYVCDGMYNIFREDEKQDKYVSVIGYDARTMLMDLDGMKVWRVEFTDTPPPADAPAPVTDAQRGPNPAPVGDVFGPWRITGASDDKWGTTDQ